MRILILSPHRDDAAFSCGALLEGLLSVGHSLYVANIFTVSAYAPYLADAREDRVRQVSQVRLKEDMQLVERLLKDAIPRGSMELIDLGWCDLPLRWGTDDEASLASGPLRSEEVVRLQETLRSLPPVDLVLCPKALGGHMDHRLVCRAAQQVFDMSALVFYDDLPYACGTLVTPSSEVGDLRGMQEYWLSGTHLGSGWKRDLCLIYSSQIDVATAESMERYGKLHGGERFSALLETLDRLRDALGKAGATD